MAYAVVDALRGGSPWLAVGLVAIPVGMAVMRTLFSLPSVSRRPWLGILAVAVGTAAAAASSAFQVVFASFILGALLYFIGFAVVRLPIALKRDPSQSLYRRGFALRRESEKRS
jgi:hypothetical protein